MTLWRIVTSAPSGHSRQRRVVARCTGCGKTFERDLVKVRKTRGCLSCTRVEVVLKPHHWAERAERRAVE